MTDPTPNDTTESETPEATPPADETVVAEAESTDDVAAGETAAETVADAEPLAEETAAALPAEGTKRSRTTKQANATKPAKTVPPAPAIVPYAIIETGGKQYRVSVGDSLSVEHIAADAGADVTIDRVLLLGGDGATRVGTPTVEGAAVTARVDDHHRGEKLVVFKFKAKKRYRRRNGHRQALTRLTITGIQG